MTRGRAQGELSLGETRLESSRPPRCQGSVAGGGPHPAAPQARTHDAATRHQRAGLRRHGIPQKSEFSVEAITRPSFDFSLFCEVSLK